MQNSFPSSRLAVAAALAIAAPAWAQSVQLAAAAPVQQVEIQGTRGHDAPLLDAQAATGSRLGLGVRDTPASVSVVERELIERRGAFDTQEILKSIPGVMAASPPGSAGAIAWRGFGTTNITQLFNGITVQYDAIAARPVDSWIVDRVEAIGGPSSFLFGAGAVGGSVNVITKLADRALDFGDARAALGSGQAVQLAAGLNRRLNLGGAVRHTLRVDANVSDSKGWVDGVERAARQLAASWLTDVSASLSHTLALEHQKELVDRPYWGTPLLNPTPGQGRIDPAARDKNYNSADGYYGQEVHWLRSITEYRANERLRLSNTLYAYSALRDYRNVEVYRYNAANTLVARSSPLLQRHDHEVWGDRVEATWRGALLGSPSDWSLGLDVSVNRQTRFPRSLSATVSSVDPLDFTTESFFSIPGMTPDFVPDRSNRVSSGALYAENRTRLTAATALVTALRHDQIELEVTNHRSASANDPAYFSRRYRPSTGRLALVHDLAPGANIYAQMSTAADPPAGILSTASFAQVRDFDLTTGRQFEIGSKFDFAGGRGAATIAAYTITRKNLSMSDPSNPGTTIPVGQQSSRGVELAASLRATPALQLEGNLAYVDARYDDLVENVGGTAVSRAGNVPSNVPALVANAWVTLRLGPSLQVAVDLRRVSKRYGNTANTVWDGAYTLLGAQLDYRLAAGTRLTLRARNLADTVYAASVTGTPMFYLGAPRSVEVALQQRF